MYLFESGAPKKVLCRYVYCLPAENVVSKTFPFLYARSSKKGSRFLTIRPDILLLFEFRTERAEYITQRLVPALQLFFNDFLLLLRFFLLPHYRRRLGTPRPRRAFFLTRARARERYDFSNFFFCFFSSKKKSFRGTFMILCCVYFFFLSPLNWLFVRARLARSYICIKKNSRRKKKNLFLWRTCA